MLQRDELKRTRDLPPELIDQLSKINTTVHPIKSHVVSILGQHSPLKTDELLIGLYRETAEIIKRATLQAHLNELVHRGIVQRVKAGVFQLTEHGQKVVDKAGSNPKQP